MTINQETFYSIDALNKYVSENKIKEESIVSITPTRGVYHDCHTGNVYNGDMKYIMVFKSYNKTMET